jgi:hypothetical protein
MSLKNFVERTPAVASKKTVSKSEPLSLPDPLHGELPGGAAAWGGSVSLGSTPTAPPRRAGQRLAIFLLFGLPMVLVGGAAGLASIDPIFYRERSSDPDPDRRRQMSNQFLQTASRLINDLQNAPAWSSEFSEDQINGWLAEDFQQNHAEKTLPAGVKSPRVQIAGDRFRLAFRCVHGPLSTVIQIGARAWVPKRNLLAIELETAQAGMLSLPTTYTRTVIEQFILDRGLEITWKRSGSSLVALIDFARAERQIILRKVEVKDGHLAIEGLSGRLAIPATDYAPTAN